MLQTDEIVGASDSGAKAKRPPRPLTGRHVRPGTGASPRTLQLLRRKVLERMRLRELLFGGGGGDECGHAFFGARALKRKGGSVGGGRLWKKRGRSER